jgi:zinc-binding in reverse transcriptase
VKWTYRKCFTTTSAYKFLTTTPFVDNAYHVIWSVKAPMIVIIFLWLMLQNKMLTIDNLIRWGWSISNNCYLYGHNNESIQHIMYDCQFTRNLKLHLGCTGHNDLNDKVVRYPRDTKWAESMERTWDSKFSLFNSSTESIYWQRKYINSSINERDTSGSENMVQEDYNFKTRNVVYKFHSHLVV